MWWIIGILYLFVGAIYGLILEEAQYRKSSDAWRSTGTYAFSAFGMSIVWPLALLIDRSAKP